MKLFTSAGIHSHTGSPASRRPLVRLLGIFGAVVGGYIAESAFHKGDVTGVNIESIVIAVLGAILVLFVWRAFTRNRSSM